MARTCIIKNLYWNQLPSVKVNHEKTEEVKIPRGVRQGYILSSLLFSLHSEAIHLEAPEQLDAGTLLNDERLNNFRNADGTVIFVETVYEQQINKGSSQNY